MKKYENYQPSVIEGIKKVPSHWKPTKLKFIGNLYSGLTGKSGNDFYNEDNPLSRPYINFKNIANNVKINPKQFDLVEIKTNELQNKVKKGDLFFLMSSENFDDIAKTAVLIDDLEDTYLNSFCRGFRIQDENFSPEFLNYLLLSGHYREILSNEAKGFTRINIQVGKINNFSIYAPFNKEEQTQIAAFLDYKTNLIDTIIEKKKQLIALLKEKRQAVINEAVTKGLNPNAKMKNSGVEWLGEIPEDWAISKLKFLVDENLKYGANESAEDDNPNNPRYIRITDFGDNGILRENTFKSLEFDIAKEYFLKEGDILFARSGATVGKTFQFKNYDGLACFAGYLIKASVNNKITSDFLYYFTKTNSYENWKNSIFVQATIQNISAEKYNNLIICFPKTIKEQIVINDHIDSECKKLDTIINKIETQIQNLQTYRQSLISEAVTGKIDVRDWQPSTKKR